MSGTGIWGKYFWLRLLIGAKELSDVFDNVADSGLDTGLFPVVLTITKIALKAVEVTPATAEVEVGGEKTLQATAKDEDGNTLDGQTFT